MRYRIVVGSGEIGHIIDTNAKTEQGARVVLGRELAQYHGDGWGRIEFDLYDDDRWQQLDRAPWSR